MKIKFQSCPKCQAREFTCDSDELQDNEGVLECDCGTMVKPAIRTIIYSPAGYFGSETLWRDPSYAFQHRYDRLNNPLPYGTYGPDPMKFVGDWQFLGNDDKELSRVFHAEMPEYDYEVIVLGE